MTIHVVAGQDDAERRSLAYIVAALGMGSDLEVIDLAVLRPDRPARRAESMFEHTPNALIESWRAARVFEKTSRPGDVLLVGDRGGLAGIFTLEQRARPPAERRQVWTVAADSTYLEWMFVASTDNGFPPPIEAVIDWEITQYRWSDRVMATSPLGVAYLAGLGVEAELLALPDDERDDSGPPDPGSIWAPEPVSRRSQTGEILRAVTSVEAAAVTVSEGDREDLVWTGLTWDALRHARGVLGTRLSRAPGPPAGTTTVVLGDPFAVPSQETHALQRSGIPVLVPEGSVASQVWPDAAVWRGADGLAALFDRTSRTSRRAVAPVAAITGPTPRSDPISRVSVGIPVFGDVRYLEECLASILDQVLPPAEVLIIDDGSRSDQVERELERLAPIDSRIRIMRAPHRGVCVARNRMLEEMSGDSFLMIDSDDLLQPEFLEKCARVLDSDARLRVVATWTEFFGAYKGVEAKPPFDARVGRRENPIVSTGALVDMRVRDQGIRFAPDLAFLYCEDWHFWSQIAASGGVFGLVPEPLIRHRVHPSSGGHMRTELALSVGRARATEPLS